MQARLWWCCILSFWQVMSGFSNANCFLEFALLSLITPTNRSFLMNATKLRMPHLQRWARQCLTCRTNCHGLEWCMPVPRVGWRDCEKNKTCTQCTEDLTCYFFNFIFAPGASEPKNMIYMSRLGIWGEGTPFRAFDDFLHAIEKRFVQSRCKVLCI